MVVNLAVEDNRDRTVATGHRLTSSRQIDDRQSPHAERDFTLDESVLIIRAPMSDHATHALQHGTRFVRVAMLISANKSGNATHLIFSSDELSANEFDAVRSLARPGALTRS